MIKGLAPSEGLIMKCLWESKKDLTVSEFVERLKNHYEREYSANTVGTYLKILGHKGFVSRYKIKGAHQYKALISKEEYLGSQSIQTKKEWYNGSNYDMMACFVINSGGIDPEDAKRLKELLDEYTN